MMSAMAAAVMCRRPRPKNVMPSSTNPAWSLTTTNASATDYTLTVMTWVAVVFTPLVLLYQGWTYWVFRRRLSVDHIPAPAGLTWKKIKESAF